MSLLKRAVDSRPVGRPRSLVEKSIISAVVPVKVHDRVSQIASARSMSVSEYVRRVLIFAVRDESSGSR
jgi:hypothetical protein